MTDTTITAVAAPEAAPETPPQQTASKSAAAEVDHTPGGWPVLPLAVAGTNTTASLLAAAALVGGPAALAVAATGAAVLGTAAAARGRRDERKTAAGRARAAGNGATARGSRSGAAGRVPGQRSAASKTSRAGGKSARAGGTTTRMGTAGRAAELHPKARKASAPGGSAAGKTRGKAGQVKALRTAQRQASPSRAANRAHTTAARRAVADTRRNAKVAARTAQAAGKGKAARTLAKGLGKAASGRNALIGKARAAKDQRTGQDIAGKRSAVRKAPARKRARRALWRSAARMQGRRLLAALVSLPLGLLGALTSPLGRKLGIRWVQHPGRRLYQRLLGQARLERAERDGAIRQAQDAEEAAADAEAEQHDTQAIADRAERPAGLVPATAASDHTSSKGVTVSGFNFEEQATEMQSAAMLYEPDGCMEILAMVEGLPEALKMIAHVMQILAERSDTEFPLEKEVANGFNDIYDLLAKAAAGAEELPEIFRRVHEQDIARHEDPRNGPEAEKGWNV
ncbi:hypothetical protein HRW07_02190 [Streptomyces lunaelactis]|uniref:hypothetical protein n=1 Tax=Streptomyces lunaelactis TaxID=1535768 RepID=UPI001585883C|nr:hypothetical protein [Streptomyces lunaelactis]NUL02076.1 hypothetical protein [Streptomyces lunaelactis]